MCDSNMCGMIREMDVKTQAKGTLVSLLLGSVSANYTLLYIMLSVVSSYYW